MAKKNWLATYGLDKETRASRVKSFERIKKWGIGFLVFIVAAMLYVLFWAPPENAYDAYGLSVSFAVCIAAGFTLISKLDMEIKVLQLLDELKK